jgi:DNA-damage-inducible protein D
MSEDSGHSRKLADMAFGEALQRLTQTKPQELRAAALAAASDETIESLIAAFEGAVQIDDDGHEYWFARDLLPLLGYTKWDNFLAFIAKAKDACTQAGHGCEDHFAGVGRMVQIGSGAEREIDDIVLSRYACYLVAQNGDSRKRPVAFAQTYFAIQTRRQESVPVSSASFISRSVRIMRAPVLGLHHLV